jgi:CHASE3 domain sensor protein
MASEVQATIENVLPTTSGEIVKRVMSDLHKQSLAKAREVARSFRAQLKEENQRLSRPLYFEN